MFAAWTFRMYKNKIQNSMQMKIYTFMEDEWERARDKESILWICDALLSSYKIIEPERKWKCRALRFALAKWYTLNNDSSDSKNNNQNSYKHIHIHMYKLPL